MTTTTNPQSAYGYDGNGYGIGDRVELHPGMDLWMRGWRYGDVIALTPKRCGTDTFSVTVKFDNGKVTKATESRFRKV